ncbi:MAG TPA: oxygenase MpaB family protein [Jatrophihabitans sp.]|nr:oxygenase MpaB family protein [Jatrophihabitans sp.]
MAGSDPRVRDAGPARLDPLIPDGLGALLAGTANVIMQLALPPVGYGVLESPVEAGQVTRHPLRRFRTTFCYLAVALLGTDDERARYRDAVNEVHRFVRSKPGSPVPYNAFDPHLQLWVAACLYYGAVDLYERMHGPMPDADAFYRRAIRFGTTLQVPPELWPPDRAAFAAYWAAAAQRTAIDEPVRAYLDDLAHLRHLPFVPPPVARFTAWVTTGFLPPRFRAHMGWTWSARDERRFAALMRRVGAVQRHVPTAVRRFPFNAFLWDLRLRIRRSRPLL